MSENFREKSGSESFDMLANMLQTGASPAELTVATIALLPTISASIPLDIRDVNSFLVYFCNQLNLPLRENPDTKVFGPEWLRAAILYRNLAESVQHVSASQTD